MREIQELATAVKSLVTAHKSVAEDVEQERTERESLAGRVKQVEEITGRVQHALAGMGSEHGGGDSPMLVRRDPGYYCPAEGRAMPNAKCATAMAHFMRAVVTGNRKSLDYLESVGVQLVKSGDLDVRAGSVSDDELGGYVVPPEFGGIILEAMSKYGVAPAHCQVESMNSNEKTFARDGTDVDVVPLDEGGEIGEVNANYSQVTLPAKLFGAFARWSESLDQDAPGEGERWMQRFARAIAKKMDQVLFNGDGSSTYGGLVGLINHANVGSVSLPVGKITFGDTGYDDIVNLFAAVPDEVYEEGNCKLFASGSMHWLLASIQDGIGRPIFIPDPSRSDFGVFGEQLVRSAVLPRLSQTEAGKKFMLFGDMRRAVRLGIRNRMHILFSPHAFFKNGQNALRVLTRFGIAVAEGSAMVALKTADE